jgi:hypothetical protein
LSESFETRKIENPSDVQFYFERVFLPQKALPCKNSPREALKITNFYKKVSFVADTPHKASRFCEPRAGIQACFQIKASVLLLIG